jgi:hypothetical protein
MGRKKPRCAGVGVVPGSCLLDRGGRCGGEKNPGHQVRGLKMEIIYNFSRELA